MTESHLRTIDDLVREKIIAEPMDGNHGETHPKGNDFTASGIPFVMASDIHNGEIDFGKCKYISKDQSDGLRKGFALPGDVLLSHKATIGQTAVVPKSEFPYLMLTPQVTYYRVLDRGVLDNKFLKYYFDSPWFQKALGLWAGAGSTRAYLGITEQKNLPIIIPDIKVQKGIVDVLSAIDEKIKLNNQISSKLEATAKLIYDYWFVQFDFPDQNGKPYKSSGGTMVYNKDLKREIPEGWEVTQLSKIANITMGQSPNGSSYNFDKKGAVFFQGSTDFGDRFPKVREYTTEPSRFAESGDILMSVRAPVGTLNVADVDCCIGRGLAALSSKDGVFFFLLNVMTNFKKIFDSRYASGTTFGAITKPDLQSLLVVRPPRNILKLFDKATRDFQDLINTNHRQNLELTELRDWLLPMLMNGQVKIK